mgnify:CR=1 FL=1
MMGLDALLKQVQGLGGPGGFAGALGGLKDVGGFASMLGGGGADSPSSWGTTMTPEGGPTQAMNLAGVGDGFKKNLSSPEVMKPLMSGTSEAVSPTAPTAPQMSQQGGGAQQSQMGMEGMKALQSGGRSPFMERMPDGLLG